MNWKDCQVRLKERLDPQRFEHSMSVSRTAFELAETHGCNPESAKLAGLLHDYARDMCEKDLLAIAKEHRLISHPVERQVPLLLHGPVGALLVQRELKIFDADILEAIAVHTTGAPGMSDLAAVVYLADIIEPSRDFPGVRMLRSLAQNDSLDAAVLAALVSGISYCLERNLLIHPISVEARNYLLGSN
ncbi:MAG TPA: HD domain-containing protein [Clostridia bacterium]|nr:HD domain-containing protein [Clostridia bacterium]